MAPIERVKRQTIVQVPVSQHFADMSVLQILDEIVEVMKLDQMTECRSRPSSMHLCLIFGKRRSRWHWTRLNECNDHPVFGGCTSLP